MRVRVCVMIGSTAVVGERKYKETVEDGHVVIFIDSDALDKLTSTTLLLVSGCPAVMDSKSKAISKHWKFFKSAFHPPFDIHHKTGTRTFQWEGDSLCFRKVSHTRHFLGIDSKGLS